MARAACPDRRLLESSLRGKARSTLFSNSVVDEFCEEATLPEMRAVEGGPVSSFRTRMPEGKSSRMQRNDERQQTWPIRPPGTPTNSSARPPAT